MRINAYEFGKISVAGETYTSDVIIAPPSVRDGWRRKEGHCLNIEDLNPIIEAKPDIVVIGTGFFGKMRVPDETRDVLARNGIRVVSEKTGTAVEEFNRLQEDCARIVAALHLTC